MSGGLGVRTAVLDAAPHRGTLAERAASPREAASMFALVDQGRRALNEALWHGPGGAAIIGSERHHHGRLLTPAHYRDVVRKLAGRHQVCVTDTCAGLLEPVTEAAVANADMLVIPMSTRVDSAAMAGATLDLLSRRGFGLVLARSIVVINTARPGDPGLPAEMIAEHVQPLVRKVVCVPWDAHLARGTAIAPQQLSEPTHRAYEELAAAVASALGHLREPRGDTARGFVLRPEPPLAPSPDRRSGHHDGSARRPSPHPTTQGTA